MNQEWAAIDLGSNSFHLLVAQVHDGRIRVIERLKRKVQLMAGFADGQIQPEAYTRGLDCLGVFAQRIRSIPPNQRVAMGTCALRLAENSEQFLKTAHQLLDIPVQVISGDREARLIESAVAAVVEQPGDGARRLVLDVGGGSTEVATSEFASGTRSAGSAISTDIGCVSLADRYFRTQELLSSTYPLARREAQERLAHLEIDGATLDEAIGTSGTIESIQRVLNVNGWSEHSITRAGLTELELALMDRRWVPGVGLPGLAAERVDIFPAGVAIVAALLEQCQIEVMRHVDTSLLQGMLLDALGLPRPDDRTIRERTIDGLAARFGLDGEQARRVKCQTERLFDTAACKGWELQQHSRELLSSAADLHELGQVISPHSYHRHGAYILKNLDLEGYSVAEQNVLVLLIRGHRRSLPALAFEALPATTALEVLRMTVLLRIAVILERAHDPSCSPAAQVVTATDCDLELSLPNDWLARNPLSAAELKVEADQLARVGIALTIK